MHLVEMDSLYEKVKNYDLSEVTNKYCKDYGLTMEQGKKYEIELKKFLFMSRVYQHGYAITQDCDKYWHTFILCTHQYNDFCNGLFGKYMHHQPGDLGKDEATLRYMRFLVDYFRHFKEIPPFDVWPMSSDIFGDNPTFVMEGQCVAPCKDIGCWSPN